MQDFQRFDQWNEVKKKINANKSTKYPSAGKIYWCSVGLNIGSEVYGKGEEFFRPVLVINAFKNGIFFGVPLSSKIRHKTGFMFHKFKDNKGKKQVALLGQARSFDAKRIKNYRCSLDQKDFEIIINKIIEGIIGKNIPPL